MNPGRLNKRIIIFTNKTGGYDEYGEPIDGKKEILTCWSSIKNKSGKEQFQADTPFAKVVTSFLIRYTSKTIDTTMKVEFKGDIYDIVYVDNYNFKNQWIEITAELVK